MFICHQLYLFFFLIHDFPTSKHKTKASLSVTREVSHKRNAESGNKVMETWNNSP